MVALGVCGAGFLLTLIAIGGRSVVQVEPQLMMILIGAGLDLPYVAVHTTIFERLIAWTRDRANLGFLMYLADALGYCGYVILMLVKNFLPKGQGDQAIAMTQLFFWVCVVGSVLSLGLIGFARYSFGRMKPNESNSLESNA
jgi:hypothetical protein